MQSIEKMGPEKSIIIYLNHSFQEKMKEGKNLSQIAKKMGYASPSLISMVLRGKRKPSLDFIQRFCEEFELDTFEREKLISYLGRKLPSPKKNKPHRIEFTGEDLEERVEFLSLLNLLSLSSIEYPIEVLVKKLNLSIEEDKIKKLRTIFSIRGFLRKKGTLFSFEKTKGSLKALKQQKHFIDMALSEQRIENVMNNFFGHEQLLIRESEKQKAQRELDNFLEYFVSKYHHYNEEDVSPHHLSQINIQFFDIAKNI
ncbi:MAG: helix-turn-helix transcriptional regulator [Bacteriovoracaceae bacterium]|nr:helix-turn-helix transcriptional regulator [Bacteriovoracaceae bacterium]